MIAEYFNLDQLNTTIKREAIGGTTTFMTMGYIIFVQPTILAAAGMDFGSVLMATCLASALAMVVMALYANYPVALAPGMGQNFYFTYTVVLILGVPWQQALGIVFIAGAIFILLSFFGIREKIINAIPNTLKSSIAVGIGLMITLIGLEWSGLVIDHPTLLVSLGDFNQSHTQLALAGLIITSVLLIRNIPGAMLIGIIITTLLGLVIGIIKYEGLFSAPPSIDPTFLKLDILAAFTIDLLPVVFTFLILDLFDTIGTLIGVAAEAKLLKNGKLPRAEKALFADAVGTVSGALLGTSTITSYVESAAGVASGARSGLASLFTAAFFILAIFCYPLIKMISGGVILDDGSVTYPTVAPALILIGVYLIKSIKTINWEDFSESIPAFITIIFIVFSFRITEGIALGFISYTIMKVFSGRINEIPWMMWLFTIIFILRYIFLGVA